MSKRKKLRTSGGEGVRPPKAPKNPRLGDSDGPPQSSEWDSLCLPEELEGRSGPIPSAEQRTEEPVQTAPSSHDEEAGAPSRLLRQPEKEPVPSPLSQNSARRFVPQFAKPRKTVTRQAELREEDLKDGAPAISQEMPPEPSAQQPGSQLQEESLGLAPWEAGKLGAQTQPTGKKAAELDHQSPEQDLKGFSLSLGAFALPVHREAVDGPSQETRAFQGSIDASVDPTGWSEPPPGSADQDVLGKSPTMEPDFLPDSQIRDALEAPDFEASPAQTLQDEQETVPRLSCQEQSHRPTQFPIGSRLDSSWPGTSPDADGGLLTELQLRTRVGIKACEAARLEDATDTVQGLVVELSSLNRLVMSTHRDLEAFKRLSYRKARLAGKAPAPYTSKGAGNLPPGERSWRDL
ncbi:uncharacterized protein C19orf57 homolog isoform X2 [Ailuropoda melanoleuca]|uniref:uncharacterized protein C19orf57 homolog isoform X2 n=1 Tax=Ailuropoda melanoleuca TaxID=9646 RepID=UPI0009481615|nr:uncharacterized protein C19orf57 homolog isoform X2 [Ailuropoda melanoleuca]